MKVSVITVAFNAARTIDDTLESVATQTYSDIEHIVIDGGSTDGTQARVVRHASKVEHFVSEPDHGIYDAMNKGVRLATGEVIGILNADDVYADNDVLSRVVMAMEESQLDAVYGDVAYFHPDRSDVVVRRYRSNHFSPGRMAWGWMPAHPTLFLRRAVYETYGLYRTDFQIAGDYEFVVRIFKDGYMSYAYLPEVLVRMRLGGVSTRGVRNTLVLNTEVVRACKVNGIKTNMLKILAKYPLKLLEYI